MRGIQNKSLVGMAGATPTVGELFRARAQIQRSSPAIEYQERQISYGELLDRVDRLTSVLASHGLVRGDRVALLSRNRPEYLEIELAAANLGVVTACLNWRLSKRELAYCVELVSPKLLIAEQDLAAGLDGLAGDGRKLIEIGDGYERLLRQHSGRAPPAVVDPEDGLVILYTSGTTGLPKGAVISHRAMVTRALVFSSELNILQRDAFVAWAPLFHMASTDHGLATLLRGGTVVIVDGFQIEPLLSALQRHTIGWFVLIPGMIDAFIAGLRAHSVEIKGVGCCGAMADLVPPHVLAEVTALLHAPYVNSFGSTETGLPPATRALIPIGAIPDRLSKQQSAFCDVRLVDSDDNEVAAGMPGRTRHPGTDPVLRLLASGRDQCAGFSRRLVSHGRRVSTQRRRLARFRRSRQIHDQDRRRERLSRGDRAAVDERPADHRSGGGAYRGCQMGRSAGGIRVAPRYHRHRAGFARPVPARSRRVQVPADNSASSNSRIFRARPAARCSATNSKPG